MSINHPINKKEGLPSSSSPLGHPLPLDEHACSVSLPTWSSVVGYEEGYTQVTDKLACGYPRFVYHPYIVKLMNVALNMDYKERLQHHQEKVGSSNSSTSNSEKNSDVDVSTTEEWDCLVLPTKESALRCHDFIVKACGYFDGKASSPRLVSSPSSFTTSSGDSNHRIPLFYMDNAISKNKNNNDNNNSNTEYDSLYDCCCYNPTSLIRVLDLKAGCGVHAVVYPAQTKFAIEAKSYWQHTGEVLSSRRAEVALTQLNQCANGSSSDNEKDGLPRVTPSFHGNDCKDINDGGQWKICPITNKPHLALYPSENYNLSSDNNTNEDGIQSCEQLNEIVQTNNPYEGIKDRIASIVGTPSSHVFLTPSGMASIYAALRSSRRRVMNTSDETKLLPGGGTSIVFGFPYLDTLKMCSRPELVPDGVEFYGHGNDQDLANLEQLLEDRRDANENDNAGISVLITEFPSNPLLNCPDLFQIRELADEYDFAVVVDDTIGNFANVDLIRSGLADAVCTSLTKLFNGRGDAMAGSIVTNPNTEKGQWMQKDLEENHFNHEGLFAGDAYAVNANSVDFLARSSQINKTTEELADWLKERDEVAVVYYPKFTSPEGYNSVLNKLNYDGEHQAGYGGLLSILLHPHICQRTFYDKLDLSKGPSLGTDFSLVCPYTLLAHYHELDFAMSYDVQPNLLRFAIGLEELETLKERFTSAFQESKLHPKLPGSNNISRSISSREFSTFARGESLRSPFSRCHGGLHILGRRTTTNNYRSYSSTSVLAPHDTITYDFRSVAGKILKENARAIRRVVSLIK